MKPKRRPAREAEIGAVYTFHVPGGRYGACQVVSKKDSGRWVEMATLDYLSTKPPSLESARRSKVLRLTWANWDGSPARCNVDHRVPWWAERVAVMEPLENFADQCRSFARWSSAAFAAYYRDRWERGARRTRKFDDSKVQVDLGGGPTDLSRDSVRAAVGPGDMFQPPPAGKVRFDALDALPSLTEIAYAGRDAGFLDYVVSRKIEKVSWKDHGQRTIDLRSSCVDDLSIEVGAEDLTLHVPETLDVLTVTGHVERLTVEGAHLDFPFQLYLHGPHVAAPPRGMEAIQSVEYRGLIDSDTSALASYSRIAELTLRGAPGKLRDASTLGQLRGLRELEICDVYELDVARWPSDWPLLEGVQIHGLRKADADGLKKTLATVPDVRIAGARSDAWIESNLGNPFREWDQDDPSFGRTACSAWKKARHAATTLGSSASQAEAKEVLHGLVASLNRLNRKYDIDTVRREEAGEAFLKLARDLGVPEAQASAWFDEWRDF